MIKMQWIHFLAFVCVSFSNAEKPNTQDLKGLQLILQKYNQDVPGLLFEMKSNLQLLKDVQEFINSLGLGPSTEAADPCVDWIQFSPSHCIKILKEQTYDDGLESCDNEFVSGRDKHLPELLTIPTPKVNSDIVKILENFPSVNAIWVNNEVSDYQNFGNVSQSMLDCIELVNNGFIRGQWFRVECEMENSVICEKTVSANYSQLVKKQVEFIKELTKFEHIASGIIQKQKVVEKRFNSTFEDFETRQNKHILNLKNSSLTSEMKLRQDISTNSANIVATSKALVDLKEHQNLAYNDFNEKLFTMQLQLQALTTQIDDKMNSFEHIKTEISKNSAKIRKILEKQNSLERKIKTMQDKAKNYVTLPITTATTTLPFTSNLQLSEFEVKVATSLPHPLSLTSTIYDGHQSIYIFGGEGRNGIYNKILKVGNFPYNLFRGGIVNYRGNIFYFGGFTDDTTRSVFKFDTSRNTLTEVVELEDTFYDGSVFLEEENSNIVLMVGDSSSQNNYVRGFDMELLTVTKTALLKRKYLYAYTFLHGGNAMIFTKPESPIDLKTKSVSPIEILNLVRLNSTLQETTIPGLISPSIVSDGTFGYIIGGYETDKGTIIRFNPITFEHEFVSVKNFPSAGFSRASAVYVKNLNRIYLVGGISERKHGNNIKHDKIWYIDLNPPQDLKQSEIFSCVNKTNGFYTYPNKSTGGNNYAGCLNGTLMLMENFTCPLPLVFKEGICYESLEP